MGNSNWAHSKACFCANVLFILGLLGASHSSFAMSKKGSFEKQGAAPLQATEETVWVGKEDNAKSCGTEKGIPLDKAAQELKDAHVTILSKKKIPDSMPRILSCGVDKGTKNGFLIHKKDLEKATDSGFNKLNPQP